MEFYDNIEKSELPVFGILMDVEKNQGRGAIIGDVMAYMARSLGAVGLIGAGSIRDLPGIINADMPVWGTGRVPGHGPFNLIETQTEVDVVGLKINSGSLNELTEVVRDLFRNSNQPEQSYSERQLYESARDRLAREVAVVEKTDDDKAVEKIEIILNDATRKSSSEDSII